MCVATSRPNRTLPALLAAAVGAVVLGIVGMHALNTHGVTSGLNHATTAVSSVMSATQPSTPGLAAGEADKGEHHGLSNMAMLCTVMLAVAAGAALLLVGVRRAPRTWSHVSTIDRATVCPGSAVARRGTGPPPAWEFSVIRC